MENDLGKLMIELSVGFIISLISVLLMQIIIYVVIIGIIAIFIIIMYPSKFKSTSSKLMEYRRKLNNTMRSTEIRVIGTVIVSMLLYFFIGNVSLAVIIGTSVYAFSSADARKDLMNIINAEVKM